LVFLALGHGIVFGGREGRVGGEGGEAGRPAGHSLSSVYLRGAGGGMTRGKGQAQAMVK